MAMPPAQTPQAPTAAADWKPLLEGEWELPAGEEGYRCVRLTAAEDMYIKEFQPIAPLGTHHTLLSVNPMPTAPDGVSTCSAGDNGHTTLLGSGVGENYSAGPLPDGVAYKVAKGSQLNLNLHLFNVSDAVLKGKSGTRVRTTTADEVTQFAETMLAGPVSLAIPMGTSTSTGKCTLKSDTTVFAVSPHMHQLGVHLKAIAIANVHWMPVACDPSTHGQLAVERIYDVGFVGSFAANSERKRLLAVLEQRFKLTTAANITPESTATVRLTQLFRSASRWLQNP
jgi:hypothetical protein